MFVQRVFNDAAGGGIDVGDIGHSLRFRSGVSAYISITLTTATTSTFFAAVKRGKLGVISPIFDSSIKFNANDTLTAFGLTTTAVFRDPTSWLYIQVSNNGLYINGVSYGAVTTSAITNPRIGFDGTNYFDGYMARIGIVDGTSAYTNFGYLNSNTNEWTTLSQSTVVAAVNAGSTKGSMLDFDDATSLTTLGYDKSSKGNNWTLNNFSLTAGTTYDHMLDVPGNSYAVLNPLDASPVVLSAGNLNATYSSASDANRTGTVYVSSGKWYWECYITSVGSSYAVVGVSKAGASVNSALGVGADQYGYISSTGNKYNSSSSTAYGATYTATDLIGIELDLDAGTLSFRKNNTSQGVAFSSLSGAFTAAVNGKNSSDVSCNFGQRPFAYTPPTGFLALNQANMPAVPTELLNPKDHHTEVLVTKSSTTQNFTIPWDASTYDTFFEIKRRDAAGSWYQIDGLRGYDKYLVSNSTAAEVTDVNVLSVSGTTCTLGSSVANGTYVISATKAGLSSARQTNTDGSITSTVSRNTVSGFSIVLRTGTGANGTVGHGLGVAPGMIQTYQRTAADNHPVWHKAFAADEYVYVNLTNAKASLGTFHNGTSPSSTVISYGSWGNVNTSGYTYVDYCYADSAIQKSFSYTGNGSADGAYANLGFKAERAVFKKSNTTSNWAVTDTVRQSYNVMGPYVTLNTSDAETSGTTFHDYTASGLKERQVNSDTYIGHAWAAVTGKYSNAR